jgi:hypothetical protein
VELLLHLHIQLTKRWSYRPFIRAVTSAIAMAITGASRWKRIKIKFKDYLAINQLEGIGVGRIDARFIIESRKNSS